MGIRITQPGESKAAAQAGTAIGKGKRAEEDRARAEREQARAAQMAAQQEARKAAMQWEQEKMAFRSQQDFQKELRDKQRTIDMEGRAKDWEVEKMALRSQQEFADELKKTQSIKDEATTEIKALLDGERTGKWMRNEIEDKLQQAYFREETGTRGYAGDFKDNNYRDAENRRGSMENLLGYKGLPLPELEQEITQIENLTPEMIERAGLDPEDFPGVKTTNYEVGSIIDAPDGSKYRVVGFAEDGEPLVEPVSAKNKYGGYGASGSF